jgi:2-desacetyl-2-hydroxyethyl bacteriochlorophyllide A dehydrogenase
MSLEPYEVADDPPPGAILARAEATLISAGTEVANYLGRTSQRTPTSTDPYYPGYSFAGVVEAVGEGVERFRPGDRICGPLPHASHAVEGRPERLARMTLITPGVTFRQAAVTQLGCIALNAVRAAGIQLGESVAVVGAGLVGLLAARLASLDGARPLAVLDLIERRREIARSAYGADVVADPRDPEEMERLRRLAPDGFDVVFEATGSPHAFAPALQLAARGARVILLGSTRGLVESFDPYTDLHLKGLRVIGAHVSTTPTSPTLHNRWTEAANREVLLSLMRDGVLDVDPLITHVVSPEQAGDAFAALAGKPDDHLGVLIDWTRR